jgi:superfamily II DNA or RNA helicase
MILVQLRDEATSLAHSLNQITGNDLFACAIVGGRNGDENTRRFRDGDYNVAIVCKKLLEGFDNSNVSICVIIRNVRSRVLFNQFVGRCVRMSELLDGRVDTVNAEVISFQRFNQRVMWDSRDLLATEDPVEEADPVEDEDPVEEEDAVE